MKDQLAEHVHVDLARRSLLGAATFGTIAAALPAAAATTQATPEEASNAMDRAIAAGDAVALPPLIAPDFLWVRSGGARTDKAAFLKALTSPGVKIDPYTPANSRWLKSGDLAVHSATNALTGSENGERFVDRHNFVDVWRRDPEGWRLVYTQITAIPAQK
jgi:ketosteroid isomerase-like protein